ncbi:MAG: Hypothetical protein C75L2_00580022 [Leptospirillum sp. Group II 'C75']|jgi:hypothetical protein|uniref:Uncharacterized protein n=1 Tax=Leptospirillum ferriphilum TaxID=178606 RepID=A0A1V3STJ3_9BACT|nr:MAG: hypothetical protein UBAL2_85240143 [Leptospirillum rubarum]EIJ75526.1 MAG: Hypothetical protein C75L2_00580022 [Leptospirillum sp. Group II 'C75']OOH71280.1 hypothetical protein BOX24_09640 [Leptospirillum ferriphilum]
MSQKKYPNKRDSRPEQNLEFFKRLILINLLWFKVSSLIREYGVISLGSIENEVVFDQMIARLEQ